MKVVIDRIEQGYAVCELPDGSMKNMPLEFLPECKEGDVVVIEIDKKETEDRQSRIKKKLDSLFD